MLGSVPGCWHPSPGGRSAACRATSAGPTGAGTAPSGRRSRVSTHHLLGGTRRAHRCHTTTMTYSVAAAQLFVSAATAGIDGRHAVRSSTAPRGGPGSQPRSVARWSSDHRNRVCGRHQISAWHGREARGAAVVRLCGRESEKRCSPPVYLRLSGGEPRSGRRRTAGANGRAPVGSELWRAQGADQRSTDGRFCGSLRIPGKRCPRVGRSNRSSRQDLS